MKLFSNFRDSTDHFRERKKKGKDEGRMRGKLIATNAVRRYFATAVIEETRKIKRKQAIQLVSDRKG